LTRQEGGAVCSEEEQVDWALSVLENRDDGSKAALLERQGRDYPLAITPPLTSCRKVLFFTKRDWLEIGRPEEQQIPPDIAIFQRYGPLTKPHKHLLELAIDQLAAPVHFVGDLDPTDLTTYATLVSGNQSESSLSKATYLGIDDEWIKLCEGDARGRPLSVCCIPLDAAERSALDRLAKLAVDWRKVVGKRSMKLLASGMKLELEGASNPALYTLEFRRKLLDLLFR
jgi:hypothetical protein